ncbi:ABC transporter permease [Ureibacillus acetophenoni]|uniref:ABC-2 type transport system permease protein n=1 Tax=Ureibacillus acetophenoni TaxID=614649 RepID=A0A285UJ77_9BACL|nr:ABC transporter permease [Ureibacillus acetophenoni]SOC41940.1 ABC-2 type transport system permease protein [Ureibacillus acetophenoni]
MNIGRIQAIFVKDYKEFTRNYAVSTMVLLPLVLAFLYNKMGITGVETYFLPINLGFTAVTTFVQCCLIAEEKEKNTLRGLMLSPATLGDILIGKGLLVFIVSAVTIALTIFLSGYEPANLLLLSIGLIVSIIFYLGLGTLCGLFTKSIVEASVFILPVMVVFSFGPLALTIAEQYPILKIAEWLPSAQIVELAYKLEGLYTLMDVTVPILVIIAWSIAAWILTAMIYKKRMVD